MIRTMIIEDEPKVRDSLIIMIQKYCPDLEIASVTSSFEDALIEALRIRPQLVFSDIQLNSPEGNGISLVNLPAFKDCPVIFLTGWKEFAVDAFRVNAVDYLLKPLNIQQLLDAVEKAKRLILTEQLDKQTGVGNLHIPTTQGFMILKPEEIIRCSAEGPYSHLIVAGDKKNVFCSINLGQIEKRLSPGMFYRVHKSHLVNRLFVQEYLRGEGGTVKMADAAEVPVSRNAKEDFLLWLAK